MSAADILMHHSARCSCGVIVTYDFVSADDALERLRVDMRVRRVAVDHTKDCHGLVSLHRWRGPQGTPLSREVEPFATVHRPAPVWTGVDGDLP